MSGNHVASTNAIQMITPDDGRGTVAPRGAFTKVSIKFVQLGELDPDEFVAVFGQIFGLQMHDGKVNGPHLLRLLYRNGPRGLPAAEIESARGVFVAIDDSIILPGVPRMPRCWGTVALARDDQSLSTQLGFTQDPYYWAELLGLWIYPNLENDLRALFLWHVFTKIQADANALGYPRAIYHRVAQGAENPMAAVPADGLNIAHKSCGNVVIEPPTPGDAITQSVFRALISPKSSAVKTVKRHRRALILPKDQAHDKNGQVAS